VEQDLLLLKGALKAFVQESCTVISGMTLYTKGYFRAQYVDDEVIGPRWETSTETRLSLPTVQDDYFNKVRIVPTSLLTVGVLRNSPRLAAKLAVPLEESEWVISERSLRAALWDAVLEPYLERCWLKHAGVTFDDQVFDQVFEETVADVEAPGVETEINLCPVAGLKMTGAPLELSPGIRLRPLEAEDIEPWLNSSWHFFGQRPEVGDFLRAQCAIEVTHHREPGHYSMENVVNLMKLKDDPEARVIANALGALRLLTNASLSIAFIQRAQRSLLRHRLEISYPQTPRPSKFLQRSVIDEAAGAELVELWGRMRAGAVAGEVDLPFRRWSGAADRLDDADRLIDYWVGLEALFSPDSTQEVKFRVALRIAAYLGESPDACEAIYQEMRHSYDWRSTVVHGGKLKEQKKLDKRGTLQAVTAKTRAYLRQAILKLLTSDQQLSIKPAESEIALLRRLCEK
jgi:hypothetical protein